MPNDQLLQYTYNTGHTRASPRSEVDETALTVCRVILTDPRCARAGLCDPSDIFAHFGAIPGTDYAVEVRHRADSSNFSVWNMRDCAASGMREDIADCDVVWGPAGVRRMEYEAKLIPQRRSLPSGPLPWLLVDILDEEQTAQCTWLDFARCLAWAILDWAHARN